MYAFAINMFVRREEGEEKMKYKVGDKVRVRSDLKENIRYGGQIFARDMAVHCGKNVEISKVNDASYCIKESDREWFWTDEMFEPVEEMSAAEALEILSEICMKQVTCYKCPIQYIDRQKTCDSIRRENPTEVVKVLEQLKSDHEKKLIETEFAWYVQIIEADTHTLKHEEKVETDIKSMDARKAEILKKYCSEHDGKYYAISERRCVVKE